MAEFSHKEAHRLFWMVKGHLNASEKTVIESAPGYFKRLWNNNEAYIAEEGFEESYQKLLDKQ